MIDLDRFLTAADRALRTVFAPAATLRPVPGAELPDAALEEADKRHAAGLMRVNHAGEVCAQALYQGQALSARDAGAREALEQAAWEETEHLAWTERRIAELGGRNSLLNPLWYAGSFALGAAAGALGDRWNLGFLADRGGGTARRGGQQQARLDVEQPGVARLGAVEREECQGRVVQRGRAPGRSDRPTTASLSGATSTLHRSRLKASRVASKASRPGPRPSINDTVRIAVADAIDVVFIIAFAAALLALVVTFFSPRKELKDEVNEKEPVVASME